MKNWLNCLVAEQRLSIAWEWKTFGHVDYHNMTGGVVALHVGVKCE